MNVYGVQGGSPPYDFRFIGIWNNDPSYVDPYGNPQGWRQMRWGTPDDPKNGNVAYGSGFSFPPQGPSAKTSPSGGVLVDYGTPTSLQDQPSPHGPNGLGVGGSYSVGLRIRDSAGGILIAVIPWIGWTPYSALSLAPPGQTIWTFDYATRKVTDADFIPPDTQGRPTGNQPQDGVLLDIPGTGPARPGNNGCIPDVSKIQSGFQPGYIGSSPCHDYRPGTAGCVFSIGLTGLEQCLWVSGLTGPGWWQQGTGPTFHAHAFIKGVQWNYGDGSTNYGPEGMGAGDDASHEGCLRHQGTPPNHTFTSFPADGTPAFHISAAVTMEIEMFAEISPGNFQKVATPPCPAGTVPAPQDQACALTFNPSGSTTNGPLNVEMRQAMGVPVP